MIIKKLEIAGLRAFEQAEFEFQPGMNLLVGVNGVGKTTVLDALRVCLSKVLYEITQSRSPKQGFKLSDIRIGFDSMTVSCDFMHEDKSFNLLILEQRKKAVEWKPGEVREQVLETPDIPEKYSPDITKLFPEAKKAKEQPLGIFYSTRRSLMIDQKVSTTSSRGGQSTAYAEAFSINRDFNIRDAAEWYRSKEALAEESVIAGRHLGVIFNAVTEFLDNCENLRAIPDEKGASLWVDKDGLPLNVAQLSDGERGLLSLVFDLSRRLSQANPHLDDPLKDGKGVVLIDEIDLHLHPKWQRDVVKKLTEIFPKCQFIATTHSPQVIGEVDEDNIIIIADGKVYESSKSYGVDSNRILEEIMDAPSRSSEIKKTLSELFELIDIEDMDKAKELMAKVRERIGSNDPEIIRAQTLIDFLEG